MSSSQPSGADRILGELLETRWSCRAFAPDPVPRADIERILELAQQTPSWCNTQPWHVTVTAGRATDRFRKGLAEYVRSEPQQPDLAFPSEYRGVYRERRIECAMQLYTSVGVAEGDRAASAAQTLKNFDLFGAPHVAIVTTEEALGVYGAVDCGLYVNTFLMAARSLGIATIPQAAIAACAPYVRAFFGIPGNRRVLCAISFGFADEGHPANGFRTTRADIYSAASWVSE